MLEQLASSSIFTRFLPYGGTVIVLASVAATFAPPEKRYQAAGLVVLIGLLGGIAMFVYNKGLKGLRRRKASAFDKGLEADAGKPGRGKSESRAAVSEISQRWKQAVTELKSAGLSLYDLPWYLLIGEPQSGKSTTLKNSGLEFPVGTDALSGAGGTRNCDWWFTNEAIILDTAGRFTFQEKNAPDSEEWSGFLKLLSKNRPVCPINGVVLTIPCTSLLNDSEEEREEKARNIREKLVQLQRELNIQFPVFILLTKCDQVLGFTEFFSRLGAQEQRQLLGWSMPGPYVQSYNPDTFHEVFQKLYERVHKWRLKILGEDISLTEIDKLFVYPEEFKSLAGPLHDYLKTIFVKTQLTRPLFFRGFYLTSGVQHGKPVAKACAQLIRNAGAGGEELIDHLQKIFERSKAFFIRDFYVEKLFPEKSLIITGEKKVRFGAFLGRWAALGSAVVLLATLAFVGYSIRNMVRGMNNINAVAERVYQSYDAEVKRARPADQPATKDESAAALKLASDFRQLSASATKGSGSDEAKAVANVKPALDEMFYLFFIKNFLQNQGRTLYAGLAQTPPGASLKEPESKRYNDYAFLWSLNSLWNEHSRNGASFDPAEFKWAAGALQDFDEAQMTQLRAMLDQLREVLNQDWEFGKRPIDLPLIPPGDAVVASNQVLTKEIAFIADGLKKVDETSVQRVVDAAGAFKSAYTLDGLDALPCGFEAADANPYANALTVVQNVLGEIGKLDQSISDNLGGMPSAGADPNLRSNFNQLTWIDWIKFDPARANMNAYLGDQTAQIEAAIKDKVALARGELGKVADVIDDSTGSLQRTAYLRFVESGLTRLRDLVTAQAAAVSAINGGNKVAADEAERALAKSIDAARSWTGEADVNWKDAEEPWKKSRIVAAINSVVAANDEILAVERFLADVKAVSPLGVDLSQASLSNASLPAGADAGRVVGEHEKIAKMVDDLEQYKRSVKCPISQGRIDARMNTLKSVDRENRSNFIAYWTRAFDNWRPEDYISAPQDWAAFKGLPILQSPNLSQKLRDDLKLLVANIQKFNEMGSDVKLSSTFGDLDDLARSGGAIEQNSNLFSETVQSMSSDRMAARLDLDQNGPNGQPRSKSIDAIAPPPPRADLEPERQVPPLSGQGAGAAARGERRFREGVAPLHGQVVETTRRQIPLQRPQGDAGQCRGAGQVDDSPSRFGGVPVILLRG